MTSTLRKRDLRPCCAEEVFCAAKTQARDGRRWEVAIILVGSTMVGFCLSFSGEDHFVKGVQEALSTGVRAGLVSARTDSHLRQLRDAPVFAVGEVPKVDGVIALKIRLGHFRGMEVPFADDLRTIGCFGPQGMH